MAEYIDCLAWAAVNGSNLQFPVGYISSYYISTSIMLIGSFLAVLLLDVNNGANDEFRSRKECLCDQTKKGKEEFTVYLYKKMPMHAWTVLSAKVSGPRSQRNSRNTPPARYDKILFEKQKAQH